jgi:hypothetical protein
VASQICIRVRYIIPVQHCECLIYPNRIHTNDKLQPTTGWHGYRVGQDYCASALRIYFVRFIRSSAVSLRIYQYYGISVWFNIAVSLQYVPKPSFIVTLTVEYCKGVYRHVRPCTARDGNWEDMVAHEDLSDCMCRCVGKSIAKDLRLVASRLYKTGLPGPGHVTCSRAVTSTC